MKKKKIGIITIYDDNNYGNRLQNYAVQEIVKKYAEKVVTIKNQTITNKSENTFIKNILRKIKGEYILLRQYIKSNKKRLKRFKEFDKNINLTKFYFDFCHKNYNYDAYIVGSDQVWNPKFDRLRDFELLTFTNCKEKIALSASFGVTNLKEKDTLNAKNALTEFKKISVREDTGKEIINNMTGRKDVETLVDPTMLLDEKDWKIVEKRPRQLNKLIEKKYILNYFLGNLSSKRKKEIERIAKENNCKIINILDENDPFYQTGPSEFLYLERNAFLICTDSFHSCIFAILYNRPFIVFDREDNNEKMNSRIETLLNKFELENHWFSEKIKPVQIECDYNNAFKILEEERKKAKEFLTSALND